MFDREFDQRRRAWTEEAGRLLDEGLELAASCERLPTPDGVYGNFVERLCALPLHPRHVPAIERLIGRSSRSSSPTARRGTGRRGSRRRPARSTASARR